MKVYLMNDDHNAAGQVCLGEFTSVTIDSGGFPAFHLVDAYSDSEIARLLPGGWREVSEGTPVGPYYKHCDIEET